MKFEFTFDEVCEILNSVLEDVPIDRFTPLFDGFSFRAHYENQWKGIPVRLAMKAQFHFHEYQDGILSFSLQLNHFFLDFVKKTILLVIQKFFWKKLQQNPDWEEFLPYITISPQFFSIDLDGLLQQQDLPLQIIHIENPPKTLALAFRLLPDKIKKSMNKDEENSLL